MLGVVATYQIDLGKFNVQQVYVINGKRYSCSGKNAWGLTFIGCNDKSVLEVTVQDILGGRFEAYTMDGVKVIGYEDGFDI